MSVEGLVPAPFSERAAAVGRLGVASEAAKAVLSGLDAQQGVLAHALAGDGALRARIPELQALRTKAIQSMDQALGQVWPRSSPSRPKSVPAILHVCGHLAELIEAPHAALVNRVSRAEETSRQRIVSECNHILDLETRLVEHGASLRAETPSELRLVAEAMDRIAAAHGPRSMEDARTLAGRLGDTLARLDDVAGSAAALCRQVGLPQPTLAQATNVAQILHRLPLPWSPLADGHADLHALTQALEQRGASIASIDAMGRTLDQHFGTAWRGEEPAKLRAAAVILSTPDDPRSASASAYAVSLGCLGEAETPHKVLRAMAKAIASHASLPVLPAGAEALPRDFDLNSSEGCTLATAYASGLADWVASTNASEILRRVRSEIGRLDPAERTRALTTAGTVEARLAGIASEEARSPLAGLREKVAERLSVLEDDLAVAETRDPDMGKRARRVAHTLRERRLALQRILSDEGFGDLDAPDPEALVRAVEWERTISKELPSGLDPSSPFVTKTILGAVGRAALEAGRILEIQRESTAMCGKPELEHLVAVSAASDLIVELEGARAEVERIGAWGDVAWLEDEGIEPALWSEALLGLLHREEEPKAKPVPPEPSLIAAVPREISETELPDFDFTNPRLWLNQSLALG